MRPRKGTIAIAMPKPIGNESRYNPGIDGLRTLAVLGVICYHLGFKWMPGGLAGVGVFFTISGFLITGNLMRSWYRRAKDLLAAPPAPPNARSHPHGAGHLGTHAVL